MQSPPFRPRTDSARVNIGGSRGEEEVSAQLSPDQAVRKFFDCYADGCPEDFGECVAPDYTDGDTGAVAWTGTLTGGATMKELSLYRATGGLLRWTRHALIDGPPTRARQGK
jgi:hypothetical protein